MKVNRISDDRFVLILNYDEAESLDCSAAEENKSTSEFVSWVFLVGLEIFSLTLDRKEGSNELEG